MALDVQYDPEADAAFVRIGPGKSVDTVPATKSINLDFDADGRLVAIEVLDVSKTAPGLLSGAARIAAE